jgi:hypothetical protein
VPLVPEVPLVEPMLPPEEDPVPVVVLEPAVVLELLVELEVVLELVTAAVVPPLVPLPLEPIVALVVPTEVLADVMFVVLVAAELAAPVVEPSLDEQAAAKLRIQASELPRICGGTPSRSLPSAARTHHRTGPAKLKANCPRD